MKYLDQTNVDCLEDPKIDMVNPHWEMSVFIGFECTRIEVTQIRMMENLGDAASDSDAEEGCHESISEEDRG